MKEQIQKAIRQFWEGKLSKDEQRKLLSDLKDEQLIEKNDLRLEFEPVGEVDHLGSAAAYQAVLDEIHRKMGLPKKAAKKSDYKKWMMAASWVCIIGLSAYLFLHNRTSLPTPERQVSIDTLFLYNQGKTIRYFKMLDGSRVALSPRSKLYYTSRYGRSDRWLELSGTARFTVAKNSTCPFIVTTKGYTTTALGTEFIINTHVANHVSVKLLTGKVVVQAGAESSLSMEAQYLSPGDELQIDESHKSFTINKPKKSVQRTNIMKRNTSAASASDDEDLSFEQVPLQRVFARIAAVKGVQIDPKNVHLDRMTFTGNFSAEETIDVILRVICQMNELNYYQEGEVFIIKKNSIDMNKPIEEKMESQQPSINVNK